jgi:PAS domain S-box-containing protein
MDAFWGFWASAAQAAAHAGVPDVSEPLHKRAKTDKDQGNGIVPPQQHQHPQHPFIAPTPQSLSWGHPTAAATAAAVALAPNPGLPDLTTSISSLMPASAEPQVKPDVKIIQRRKRNAYHSRATRVRKKNLELELCLELRALQNENDRLRTIVKREIPEKEAFIIGECCYKTRGKGLFQGDHSSRLGRSDFELIESLAKGRESYVLTDPRLPDNPIVYASCAFLELTGYTLEDVIGRNCRFLQGIHTDHKELETIREAIDSGIDGSVCILNYKADGTPFWNHLFVAALRDKDNNIVNYVRHGLALVKPQKNCIHFTLTNWHFTFGCRLEYRMKSRRTSRQNQSLPLVM